MTGVQTCALPICHVSVPYAGIDYDKHTIDTGVDLPWEVDPDTIQMLP